MTAVVMVTAEVMMTAVVIVTVEVTMTSVVILNSGDDDVMMVMVVMTMRKMSVKWNTKRTL